MGRSAERRTFAVQCAAIRFAAAKGIDAAPLLPRADPGWLIAVHQKHVVDFSALAQGHGMDLRDYMKSAADWLSAQTANAEVRLRMRPARFEEFLGLGRYLTQFELPMTFSGGAKHRGVRMMLEHTVLGVPPSARPADRPIYAYLEGSDEGGQIQQYGEVVLRLRPSARRRATFMLGDSLDHALQHFQEPAFAPCPVTRPRTYALLPYDVRHAGSLADAAPPYGYAEAQLYGGLRPQDIAEAVYTVGSSPSPSAVALLNRLRVQWNVMPEAGP